MKLDEIIAWYQKKIGTYDKQQWEKTVEQKILDGFSSVTLKNAKLKTELIDVDLVRGSTFPKAKPKQTLLTVIRLAILRYLFLPVYAQWWVQQTSPNTFGILIFLYITQMVNWAIYTFHVHRLNAVNNGATIDSSNNHQNNATLNSSNIENIATTTNVLEHSVSITELLIPMALSLLLSLIHSQIVATNSVSGGIKSKRRRFSGASLSGCSRVPRNGLRARRRRKLVKQRNQDLELNTAKAQRNINSMSNIKLTSQPEIISRPSINASIGQHSNGNEEDISTKLKEAPSLHANVTLQDPPSAVLAGTIKNAATKIPIMITAINKTITNRKSTEESKELGAPPNQFIDSTADSIIDRNLHLMQHTNKKRNVNWYFPVVGNYYDSIEGEEEQKQTSSQTAATFADEASAIVEVALASAEEASVSCNKTTTTTTTGADDANNSLALKFNTVNNLNVEAVINRIEKRTIGDDDGFESFNGKSSSSEEINSPPPTVPPPTAAPDLHDPNNNSSNNNNIDASKPQLRFRLNANNYSMTTTAARNVVDVKQGTKSSDYRKNVSLCNESDYDQEMHNNAIDVLCNPSTMRQRATKHESTEETDEEGGDDVEMLTSPSSIVNSSGGYNECTTSATEWLGITTNSEECSYSSELENSDDYKNRCSAPMSDDIDCDGYDMDFMPTTILNAHGTSADRISCTIWDQCEVKKAQMSVLEISSSIIERVESMPETNDYIYIGIFFSFILSLVPSFCRLCEVTIDSDKPQEINYLDLPMLLWKKASFSFMTIFQFAFGHTQWQCAVLIIGLIQRLCLTLILFIIFAVAERTFKQRFLYGKLFSHLTSSRRARKSNLPHFRLNKVRNIKTWLSVRSYLKKRGPQRSVDVIVSAAFIVTLFLLAFLSVEWLKDSVQLHSHLNLEALLWSAAIGIFLLRFMTLGNKIHHKYRSVSVLITEQINLYLQIEQKPKKKEELMVSNSVLKLAADLLKELETPFKISGLSANPYLFTTVKVVILSALSGVLSEMLGFKLKLHKIKIK